MGTQSIHGRAEGPHHTLVDYGSEVFGQETDQEEYFYVNALNDFDMESDY